MSPVLRNRTIGLVLAFAIFAVDQWLKGFVVDTLGLKLFETYELLPFFDFRLTHNKGISLGMFQAESMEMRWALIAITGAIALVVTVWMLREKLLGDILGLALILGGALGNIKDRYDLGYVIDFADFHLFGQHFYIFNVADAAITIGVVIILARSFLLRDKGDNQTNEPAPEAAES